MTSENERPDPRDGRDGADAPTEEATRSIGANVTAAREAAGLSLVEVSERTRIRRSVIESIEHDDFSHCGGDVYAKGHLRSIGSAVGADASDWVAAYDRQFGTAAPSATEVFDSETSAVVVRRRGVNWSAIMAAALVIAVGLVVVQIASSSDDPARTPATVSSPEPTPTDTATDDQPSDDSTQIAEAETKEVLMRIAALPGAASWVQVSRPDGSVVFSDTISDGQSKTFRDAKRLDVVVGNAAGVELTVNGQDLGTPGASGEVARLSFTPKDPVGAAG